MKKEKKAPTKKKEESEIEKTEVMLAPKNIIIRVTPGAREWLATNGYDPKMGARPFERLFEQKIKKPLSKEILFGKLKDGGRAVVNLDAAGEIVIFVSNVESETVIL